MAKYRHRTFEMYDFRAEAIKALTPKSTRLKVTTVDPQLWSFRHLDVALCDQVISVQFNGAQFDQEEIAGELKEDFISLADKLTNDSKLLLDFTGVESISPAAIEAIGNLNRQLQHKGSRIVLCCLSPTTREAFFPHQQRELR